MYDSLTSSPLTARKSLGKKNPESLSRSSSALRRVAQLVGRCPTKQKVTSLIRAHARVVGLVLGLGVYRRQPIDVPLSH